MGLTLDPLTLYVYWGWKNKQSVLMVEGVTKINAIVRFIDFVRGNRDDKVSYHVDP